MMAGVNLVHVPYRGGAPATTDLVGGHMQVIFSPVSESIEQIKAGKLRAPGGNDRDPIGRVAGRSNGGRLRARL